MPDANSASPRRSAAQRLRACSRSTARPTKSMRLPAIFARMAPKRLRSPNSVMSFREITRCSPSSRPACRSRSQHAEIKSALKGCEVDWFVPIELAFDLRQRIFQAARAIEQHDLIGRLDAAVGQTLFVGGVGGRSFRTEQESLFPRHL